MYATRYVMLGLVAVGLVVFGTVGYYLQPGNIEALVHDSVEFNLARLSPDGHSVGYAVPASGASVPPTLDAVCNADGSATFTWSAGGAQSYSYYLDNKTRGGWEFSSQPCSASPINGDYCSENVQTTSLTVGAGVSSPQEYAFNYQYNVWYSDYTGAEGGGSVIRSFINLVSGVDTSSQGALLNTYNGGYKTITCGPTAPVTPTCSIAVGDCTITTVGGMCDASATWSATNALDNQVKVALVWPNGFEDLWSRYAWPPFGYAPANYNGTIAGFPTPGNYTAKVYDKHNVLCATDNFTVTMGAVSCPSNAPYTETNYASIKNYCDVNNDVDNNDTPPTGMTYPTSMACNAAPGWQPYGPTCTAPNCDCTYIPIPAVLQPNLQSVPQNFKVVKGASLLSSAAFDTNESITFIATSWNVGLADVSTSTPYFNQFQYRLASTTGWTTFATLNGVPLGQWPNGANGGARNELGTTSFATPGTYEIRHCTDATSVITESSEADNCSSGSGIVTVTIDPGGTSAIQGYHVDQAIQVAFPSVVITTGAKSASGNPYQITGLAAGSRTVTSAEPSGYEAQYCVSSVSQDCSSAAHYTTGKSVSVTLANGETKNIWWRYIPDTFNIDFDVALIGTSVWSNSLTTTAAQRHVKLRWSSPEADDGCVEVGSGFDTGATNPNSGTTTDADYGASAVTEEPKTAENSGSTKTYRIKCTKNGSDLYKSVTVTDAAALPPTVDLKAKAGLIRSGQVAQLGWTATNATSCTLSGGGVSYTTTTEFSRSEITNPYNTGALTSTQSFTLTCQNSIGLTGSDSVRVEVTGSSQEI